jgi:hypothetical protein
VTRSTSTSVAAVAFLVGIPGLGLTTVFVLDEVDGPGFVLVDVGKCLAAIAEEAVVVPLLELPRFTKAASPSFSGHVTCLEIDRRDAGPGVESAAPAKWEPQYRPI